jgi:hypothetical protein
MSIPLGPFQKKFSSKICGDIRSSRCTTGVIDTTPMAKGKKFYTFFWTPLGSSKQIDNFFSSGSL